MNESTQEQIPDRKLFVAKLIESCSLCPRACGVNRLAVQTGFCGLDHRAWCFREMLHPYEEKELSPSHQVYYTGCNLRCEFCTVDEWNQSPVLAESIELDDLVSQVSRRRLRGAVNLNLLGGEPAVNLYGILDLLDKIDFSTTVVWNSSMYYSRPVNQALEGLVNIYLADLKTFDAECSRKILAAADYFPVASRRIEEAAVAAEVIVRHLVLPGHISCCTDPILRWLAKTLPLAKVSLRWDYVPPAECAAAPRGYLSAAEKSQILKIAADLKLNLID